MRKIISNTTPILSLLKINKLVLLKELYGKVTIPNAVFHEIENGKEKGLIKSVSELLTELTKKGTWLNPKLISRVKKLSKD